MSMASDFYLRYYVGHKGKFGHEFLEFEFRPDGERSGGRGGAGKGESRGEVRGLGWPGVQPEREEELRKVGGPRCFCE